MSTIPAELSYTKSHEWVSVEDDVYTIGLTDFAQDALGDLVFVNLPQEGDEVEAGQEFADVESVKAVSDVYSPVTGVIVDVNEVLLEAPESINEDPYGAWFVRVSEVTEVGELLDAEAYAALCEQEA
jgi:glycine cleavage system H protein